MGLESISADMVVKGRAHSGQFTSSSQSKQTDTNRQMQFRDISVQLSRINSLVRSKRQKETVQSLNHTNKRFSVLVFMGESLRLLVFQLFLLIVDI